VNLISVALSVLSGSGPVKSEENDRRGLIIALGILTNWAVSLTVLFRLDVAQVAPGWIALAMSWQVLTYTGLFITAHDAMHGVVCRNPRLNRFIGTIALLVYALLPYEKLRAAHWEHHHHPASDLDPDFHDGQHSQFPQWYLRFMWNYRSGWSLLGLIAIYHLLHRLLHIPEQNLLLFWVIPSPLSSLQLFFFGTYLPHRRPQNGYQEPDRAQSLYFPVFWSLLSCYHFGYHREHHENPQAPWWKLPTIARSNRGTLPRFLPELFRLK
jgi:beta-carotene ketolase (CrtW type)